MQELMRKKLELAGEIAKIYAKASASSPKEENYDTDHYSRAIKENEREEGAFFHRWNKAEESTTGKSLISFSAFL